LKRKKAENDTYRTRDFADDYSVINRSSSRRKRVEMNMTAQDWDEVDKTSRCEMIAFLSC